MGTNFAKIIFGFTYIHNKLECLLSQASLSSLFCCLRVRLDPTKKKGFSGAPLLSNLLALPTNIRLGWKGLPRLTL
jgi:hypothetical protein